MVLEDSEQPETPEGSALSADLELMEFSTQDAQKLMITNDSSEDITVEAFTETGKVIADPGTAVVPAGGSVEFAVIPARIWKQIKIIRTCYLLQISTTVKIQFRYR